MRGRVEDRKTDHLQLSTTRSILNPDLNPPDGQFPSEALVRRAASGQSEAVEALLKRHLPDLHTFIRLRSGKVLRTKEHSEDLVQSVCREVLEDLHEYPLESEGRFRYWLFRAAERKVVDRARYWAREKRDVKREAPLHASNPAGTPEYDGQAASGTPSQVASAREQADRLERALATLSDQHRQVILLHRIVGLSHAEIGEQWGKSAGAVKSLLHRALAKLGNQLLSPPPEA